MCDASPEEQVNVWLWQYPQNRNNMGDVCLTATPRGCKSLQEVLHWVVAGEARQKTLSLPTLSERDADCISLERPFIAFHRLEVRSSDVAAEFVQVDVNFDQRTVSMTVTPASISTLDDVLSEVAKQQGDWYVPIKFGDSPGTLWYWPCMGHTHTVREPESSFPEYPV